MISWRVIISISRKARQRICSSLFSRANVRGTPFTLRRTVCRERAGFLRNPGVSGWMFKMAARLRSTGICSRKTEKELSCFTGTRPTATPHRASIWPNTDSIADSIVMNRSDGALVRIVTGLKRGESPAEAEARAVGFAQIAMPLLDRYIPQYKRQKPERTVR